MEVTRCSLLSQLYSGYSSSFLVLFLLAHRPLLAFTFQSLLSSCARFWHLPTFAYSSSTLVSPGTAISIKSAVLLSSTTTISVVCVQSRCPSGYFHPVGFWLSPSLSLVQPYVGTIISNAAGHTSHTDSRGQFQRLCHVSSSTSVVSSCCIH